MAKLLMQHSSSKTSHHELLVNKSKQTPAYHKPEAGDQDLPWTTSLTSTVWALFTCPATLQHQSSNAIKHKPHRQTHSTALRKLLISRTAVVAIPPVLTWKQSNWDDLENRSSIQLLYCNGEAFPRVHLKQCKVMLQNCHQRASPWLIRIRSARIMQQNKKTGCWKVGYLMFLSFLD